MVKGYTLTFTNVAKTFTVESPEAPAFTTTWLVAAGAAATIAAGTPVKGADAAAASPWTGAVVPMVDGDGSTSQRFIGIAKNTSTDTASAAGVVTVLNPLPGIIYKGFAKTSTTADTAAEVLALQGKRVVLDLTSTDWTIDAAAADAKANCVVIAGGDYQTATLNFLYAHTGTWMSFEISA